MNSNSCLRLPPMQSKLNFGRKRGGIFLRQFNDETIFDYQAYSPRHRSALRLSNGYLRR